MKPDLLVVVSIVTFSVGIFVGAWLGHSRADQIARKMCVTAGHTTGHISWQLDIIVCETVTSAPLP